MIYKQLLINLICFLVITTARADNISVSQSLDKQTIPYEDSATFVITLSWDGPQWGYLFNKPLNPQFDRLRIKGFSSSIRSAGSGADEVTTKTYKYTLLPTSSGLARIEPVTISYLSMPDSTPGELVTEAMTIQVAEPIPVKQNSGDLPVWLIIIIIVVVLGGAGLVVFILLKRKKASVPKAKSPVEKVLDELDVLKKESAGDMKKFQTGLYRILSGFCVAQYNINPDDFGDEAFVEALDKTNLSSDVKGKISTWLINARKDKFRPVNTAPGDAIRLETEVRELFGQLM